MLSGKGLTIIHPDYQNNGIGTRLVKQAITDIKLDGIRCIHTTFEEKLERFYQKFGFYIFKGGIIDYDHMEIEK